MAVRMPIRPAASTKEPEAEQQRHAVQLQETARFHFVVGIVQGRHQSSHAEQPAPDQDHETAEQSPAEAGPGIPGGVHHLAEQRLHRLIREDRAEFAHPVMDVVAAAESAIGHDQDRQRGDQRIEGEECHPRRRNPQPFVGGSPIGPLEDFPPAAIGNRHLPPCHAGHGRAVINAKSYSVPCGVRHEGDGGSGAGRKALSPWS